MKRRNFLAAIGASGVVLRSANAQAAAPAPAPGAVGISRGDFELTVDLSTGSLASIVHTGDPARMNWLSSVENAPWQPRSSQWGLGYADLGEAFLHRGRWENPLSVEVAKEAGEIRTRYQCGPLMVEVERKLLGDAVSERYTFTNQGGKLLPINDWQGTALAIAAPFNDHYTSTADVLEHRCHAHLWMGGSTAWVATMRMGGRAPHPGMVLTEGALDSYSIIGRDTTTSSNTRGTFLLHPDVRNLQPGQSRSVGWTLFWHTGWDDFFKQCLARSPSAIVVEAARWTAFPGEDIRLSFRGRQAGQLVLTAEGKRIPLSMREGVWTANIHPGQLGEAALQLAAPDGSKTRIAANVSPTIDDLIGQRLRFIVARQQVNDPGDPLDGAFIVYDNETEALVRKERDRDRNEGRERIAMSVLLAMWLQKNPDAALQSALMRSYRFVCDKLQRADGFVLDGVGSKEVRLYNWPWVAELHLEVWRLTKSADAWRRFMLTIESFYANGGAHFYAIGIPIYEGMRAAATEGARAGERLRELFTAHGEQIVRTGLQYPAHEVNFEQSIVAPATIILLELHRATGEARWLRAAEPHLALLELFNGRQPDHRLHEVAIRHWDGYWFGKKRLWGDTFPHYWSTLTALAFDHYAKAGGPAAYAQRADNIIRNNLSLFSQDGRGSAAFIYPQSVNGQRAHTSDPYANDQDWALVHALRVRRDGGGQRL